MDVKSTVKTITLFAITTAMTLSVPAAPPLIKQLDLFGPKEVQAAEVQSNDFVITDGVLTEYRGTGGRVVIPDGVKEIAHGVLYARPEITHLVVPASVTKVGGWSFAFGGLQEVVFEGVPESIDDSAFRANWALTKITIPGVPAYVGTFAFDGTPWYTEIMSGFCARYGITEEQRWEIPAICINGKMSVKIGEKYGVVDFYGNELLPPVYEEIKVASDGSYEVKQNGNLILLDKNGNPFEHPAEIAQSPLVLNVNGSPVVFPGQQPVAKDGTILVPVEWVLREVGMVSRYDVGEKTFKAAVVADDNKITFIPFAARYSAQISMPLGSYSFTITTDDSTRQSRTYAAPIQFVNYCLMVPLQAALDMVELADGITDWYKPNNTANISIYIDESQKDPAGNVGFDEIAPMPETGGPYSPVMEVRGPISRAIIGWRNEAEVLGKMLEVKSENPTGSVWDVQSGGCGGFAAKLRESSSGSIFNKYGGTIHQDLTALRVGDIIWFNWGANHHVVVVLEVQSDGVIYADAGGDLSSGGRMGKAVWGDEEANPMKLTFDYLVNDTYKRGYHIYTVYYPIFKPQELHSPWMDIHAQFAMPGILR